MKKKWLSVMLAFTLLALSAMPLTGSTSYLPCVPGVYESSTYYPARIEVWPNQYLIGKFYYPDAGPAGPGFAPNYLPGVLLTHGFGETYADVEGLAAALARNCGVALATALRLQGRPGQREAIEWLMHTFNVGVSGLQAGRWTARAHLDDGNDYSTTFWTP